MKCLFNFVITIIWFGALTMQVWSQSCTTHNYNPPSLPGTYTYTYTSSGWEDSLGNLISPPSNIGGADSVAILSDNADAIANTGFKGFLYVAPGVTYSGEISSINGAEVIIAGTVNFPTNPSFQNTDVYIEDTGTLSVPGTFSPSGSSKVYNKGVFDVGEDLQIGGTALYVGFSGSRTTVQLDASVSSEYVNCGILEVYGSLSTGGSSALGNYCSIYIHTDMSLNADYTNNGLFVLDGTLSFGTATFYNYGTMLLNNIALSNDNLVGNDIDSILIVRNNASLTSGASVTGHMYYDVDDGGGFDTVCASCIEGIDVLLDVTIPSTTELILEDCGANIVINPVLKASKLDFDGVDDYVSTPEFIDGQSNITVMAWVKTDSGNSTDMVIAGEDTGCKLWLQNGNRPTFTITSQGNTVETIGGCSCSAINYDEWHHMAGTYNSTTGAMELYIDGELVDSSNVGNTGAVIENSASANGNFEIGRLSSNVSNQAYFKGDIDEVRVFDIALTNEQIKVMVYQEIQEVSGLVRGTIIPKDFGSLPSCGAISWSSLIAYYPMTDVISYDRTTDYSINNRITKLHNITSFQEQTAPIPYTTSNDGAWTSQGTWEHGDVWDIENITDNKDWSIVKIANNVSTSDSHTALGMFIDSNKTLTVNGSNLIKNTWYLELNGTLDLMNDSQLVQTNTSDLVTSADGKVLRRQEGTPNAYWYNYWSSPTGATGVTSLTDNNAATNNANNSPFTLNMLKDGLGSSCQFTTEHTGNGNISLTWLYTYKNGKTYWDWLQIGTSSSVETGVGYTQKGTGVSGSVQQYIFEGKPNNGTILVNVTDVGGLGSVPDVSRTSYLLGNPYPSALDISKFIDDNAGIIGGYLYLWQQWSGSSHYLNEYNGGYAQVNKTGAVRAYQFVGFSGAHNGSQDGTLIPTKYLPVGQGFITEIVADGVVEFNNSQRIFILEEDADGTLDNGSVFFKSTKSKGSASAKVTNDQASSFKKMRLEFSSVSGPDTRRELLLGFSSETSDAYDYGYDAEFHGTNNNDLNLNLDGSNMNIQAYGELTEDKVIPLNFRSSGNNSFEIKLTDTQNFEESEEIYLKDNLTGEYFDLKQGTAYGFSSDQGKFNERFEIVFQSEQQALSVEESNHTENFVYYSIKERKLYIKKLNTYIKRMALISMTGQTVMELQNIDNNVFANGIEVPKVSSGAYVACFRTDDDQVLTKKIIVN